MLIPRTKGPNTAVLSVCRAAHLMLFTVVLRRQLPTRGLSWSKVKAMIPIHCESDWSLSTILRSFPFIRQRSTISFTMTFNHHRTVKLTILWQTPPWKMGASSTLVAPIECRFLVWLTTDGRSTVVLALIAFFATVHR